MAGCLVSVEGRDDVFNYQPLNPNRSPLADLAGLLATADVGVLGLLAGEAQPVDRPQPIGEPVPIGERLPIAEHVAERLPAERFERAVLAEAVVADHLAATVGRADRAVLEGLTPLLILPPRKQLVLLHSWTFECQEGASFQELCAGLDVGLFGEVRATPAPVMTDTGHLALQLTDRAGSTQLAWYRGPLVPWPLTRDARGPYHSADQCRRISPETGLEDIAYAAAFGGGPAAADARLAQELMRWRRRTFRRAVLLDVRRDLRVALNLALDPALIDRLAPRIAAGGGRCCGPVDLSAILELGITRAAEGLQPDLLALGLCLPDQAAQPWVPAGTRGRRGGAGVRAAGAERPAGGGARPAHAARQRLDRGHRVDGSAEGAMSTKPWISADEALRAVQGGEPARRQRPRGGAAALHGVVPGPSAPAGGGAVSVPGARSRLLPDESIRFFYLDRSWTDRLVDGAMAVGQIGTRSRPTTTPRRRPCTAPRPHRARGPWPPAPHDRLRRQAT
ncbi:MAG: hypothetical protein R3F43_19015 [bacterium]